MSYSIYSFKINGKVHALYIMSYVEVCILVISPDIPLLLVWLFDFLFHVSSTWTIYFFIDCAGRSTMASTYMLTNQITLLILD